MFIKFEREKLITLRPSFYRPFRNDCDISV